MLKTMALCLFFILLMASPAPASEDADFECYLCSVADLDGSDPSDAQKAARAFTDYVQIMLPGAADALAAHMDYPVLIESEGKTVSQTFVAKNLTSIFNGFVLSKVRKIKPDAEIFVRNQVEYGIGDGAIWFTFANDDVKRPVIFAINNKRF